MNIIKFKILLFFYNLSVLFFLLLYMVYLTITLKIKVLISVVVNNFTVYKTQSLNFNLNKIIWVHASSVGESLMVFPIIKDLLVKYPNYNFLVTTCTKSSRDLWLQEFSDKVSHYYLPCDFKYVSDFFIKSISPMLAIFVEADFWPNFLLALKRNQIPTILLNGRMSVKSFKRWNKIKFFIKHILDTFNLITVDSLQSLKFFKNFVDSSKVIYFGNLKYVNKSEISFNQESLVQLRQSVVDKNVVLALSTHYLEETMFAEVHSKIKKTIPNLLTIIIPRHTNRKKDILRELQKFNLKINLYSDTSVPEMNTDIFLIDVFGKTNLFFEISKVVYIGKSMFKSAQGGHNLLEPMRFGKPVIFGPYMNNFTEICKVTIKEHASVQVSNPQELQLMLIQLLKDVNKLKTMSVNAKIFANKDNQIKENSIKLIEKFLLNT